MKAPAEIRIPKSEIRRKSEYRNPKRASAAIGTAGRIVRRWAIPHTIPSSALHSAFGFRPSFGFRISDFGFPRLLAFVLCLLLVTSFPCRPATNTPPTGPKDAEAQADTLARYAMPGPEHKLLDRMAGSWDTFTRYWPAAGAEAVEAKGTSQRKWILEGRFLMEELDGGNLALPFRGLGLYGYDAFEQKHTSAWVDTLNTSILTNLGAYDRTNDLVNFNGQYKDPWTGTKKKERGVTRFVSKDKHLLEIYVTEPDGKEFKMLEITYTRQAAPSK